MKCSMTFCINCFILNSMLHFINTSTSHSIQYFFTTYFQVQPMAMVYTLPWMLHILWDFVELMQMASTTCSQSRCWWERPVLGMVEWQFYRRNRVEKPMKLTILLQIVQEVQTCTLSSMTVKHTQRTILYLDKFNMNIHVLIHNYRYGLWQWCILCSKCFVFCEILWSWYKWPQPYILSPGFGWRYLCGK